MNTFTVHYTHGLSAFTRINIEANDKGEAADKVIAMYPDQIVQFDGIYKVINY